MAVSTRTRFEVFKRDGFTCRYCGRESPEVILEIDHILALANGGSDDPINLATSCWDCNRGKGAVPLSEIMTGEDPHDRAIEIAEAERQLAEYNAVVAARRQRQEDDLQALVDRWCEVTYKDHVKGNDVRYLKYVVRVCPVQEVLHFMDISETKGIRRLQYVAGCVKNWLAAQGAPIEDPQESDDEAAS
jgi:hypothetical protein